MIDTPALYQYLEQHTTPTHPLLAALDHETNLKFLNPQMISGSVQAQFLQMICTLTRPQTIVEIGTYTGYTALAMAMATPAHTTLHTIDHNPELQSIHQKYAQKTGLQHKIFYHYGKAVEILPNISGIFDLVFIDADKENYHNYYNLIINRVPKGGIIIADNVLWKQKVLQPNTTQMDKKTAAMHHFNAMVQADARVNNLLLPLRDGLMMMIKN
jgi:predicted O-methyltransferase YrrM